MLSWKSFLDSAIWLMKGAAIDLLGARTLALFFYYLF